MPPKKREKSEAEGGKAAPKPDHDDHEHFLQAFEKPTQIYRYLRTRNMLKPVFLYRTLTYMRHRMSRNNKERRTFRVDSLLEKVTSRMEHHPPHASRFLTLTFLGFYQKGWSEEEPVKVETLLLKICHKKRKDVSCPLMTVSLGTSYVAYNPCEELPPAKAPTVCIPTESFSLSGHLVKSYHLLLRCHTSHPTDIHSEGCVKKRKMVVGGACEGVTYGTDLVIYDKQQRCLLTDGDYDFYLDQLMPNSSNKIAHALSTWEQIDTQLKVEEVAKCGPRLKVRLEWSREAVTPLVDRPPLRQPPIQPSLMPTSTPERSKIVERSSVVYQFLYNNNSKQQTEASSDMHCPWCSIDCATLYSLLKHLKLCHPRFSFTYVATGGGARIDVSLNEGYDGGYCGAPGGGGGGGPSRRTPLSHLIVCHPRRPTPHLNEFIHLDESDLAQRPYITGHNRLYHHTTTCLPIYPKEVEADSEDERDPRWLQTKTTMMIDEFTDVNDGEKELMKMWNLHVMRHGFVGDCQIPLACSMFLDERGEQLLSSNLYRNFVLHMSNLFDFGLVSPVTLYTTIQKLQEMIGVEDTKVLEESVLSQREAWRDGGGRAQEKRGGSVKEGRSTTAAAPPPAQYHHHQPPQPPTVKESKKRKLDQTQPNSDLHHHQVKRRLSLPVGSSRRKGNSTMRQEISLRRRSLSLAQDHPSKKNV